MRPLLLATILCLSAALLHADDVAVMELQIDSEKQLLPVVVELYPGDAPGTVANFEKLARQGFYEGLLVHRAFPHTLVQMGDPLTRHRDRSDVGTGGPGYTIPPEIHRRHTLGAVSMARLPDKINPARMSNGSQFFVCLKPMPEYDGKYTVFGRVISGLNFLQDLSTRAVDTNDAPVDPIYIRSLVIVPRESAPMNGAPIPLRRPWWKPIGSEVPAAPKLKSSPAPESGGRHWWQIGGSKNAEAAPAPAPAPSAASHSHGHTTATSTTATTSTVVTKSRKPWWKLWGGNGESSNPPNSTAAAAKNSPKKPWWKLW